MQVKLPVKWLFPAMNFKPFSSKIPVTVPKPSLARPTNRYIPFEQFTLISVEGENKGVITLDEAMKSFDSSTHELTLFQTSPPLCRILPKLKHVAKAKTRKVKEMEFNTSISSHDYQVKITKIKSFLEKKYDIQFTLVFKKAGISLQDLFKQIIEETEEVGKLNGKANLAGRQITFSMGPKKGK
jgi:translation initiation factor IF-3